MLFSIYARLFIICSSVILICSCASPRVQPDHNEFYLALTDNDTGQKIKLFEIALSSPNEYVRQASAEELAILMSRGNELSSGAMKAVRREARGFWGEAFEITNNITKEKVISFLLSHDLNTASFQEARNFILRECEKNQIVFTKSERAVIDGHFDIANFRFIDALNHFRNLRIGIPGTGGSNAMQIWPDEIPPIFIQYPNLINDLGRSFWNTQSGNECIALFLRWEAVLAKENASLLDQRYRLLYNAGRIARARGTTAVPTFERALALAPDNDQSDICIWNILNLSTAASGDIFIERLARLAPLWHKGGFFNDIMERYLQRLTAEQNWNKIIRVFNVLKNSSADVPKAAFAWIIERTIEENLLSKEDNLLAARAVNASSADPLIFARIAYNASGALTIPSLYYRSRTAAVLGLPFMEYKETAERRERNTETSPALQFLLDFFKYDAAHLANPYIRSMEKELSPAELRTLAEAYSDAKIYNLSMRLIQVYIFNESYSPERRDLELMFPRPYLELIEPYARQYNLEPSMMLGLIRAESAFQPAVVSRSGAVGLAQFMPRTAEDVADRIRRAGGPNYAGPDYNLDRTIPQVSVHMGCFYLNMRRNELNSLQLALMAYNGGVPRIRTAQRANPNLPPDLIVEVHPTYETRDYGRRVPGFAAVYQALYY